MAGGQLVSYRFSQTVNYPSYLQTQIQGLGLSTPIDHIDTDSSTNPLTVTLWFQGTLSASDQQTLNNYMASYTDPTVSQNAMNSILSSLQTDSNVVILARDRLKNDIPSMDVLSLLNICNLLGINPNS